MGIIETGGAGQAIGEALSNAGQLASQVANPKQQIQRRVKELMASNPNAIREMAASYRDNPDALRGLVGPNIADSILATPPDFTETLARANKVDLNDMLKDPKKLATYRSFRQAAMMGTTPVGAVTEPAVANAAKGELAGPNAPDLVGTAARHAISGEGDFERAMGTAKTTLLNNAMKYIGGLPDVDKRSAMEMFNGAFTQENLRLQTQLWFAKDAQTFKQTQDNIDLRTAADAFQKSDHTGNIAAWYDVATNKNGAAERSALLAQHPDLAKSAEDKNLLAIGQYNLRKSSAEKAVEVARVTSSINAAEAILNGQNPKIQAEGEADRSRYLADINGYLGYLAAIKGEKPIIAVYGNPAQTVQEKVKKGISAVTPSAIAPYEFGRHVFYKDADGNILNTEQMQQKLLTAPGSAGVPNEHAADNVPATTSSTTGVRVSPSAQQLLDAVNSHPNMPDRIKQKLFADNPTLVAELKSAGRL